MKSKKLYIALLLLALLMLSACSSKVQLDGRLLQYDLGEGSLETSDGRSIPYQIQGVLGIPEGENCPVVVLVHGAHPIAKASEDRYDTGFKYLAQALSEQGNLVISLNVGINYSFEDGEPNGNERSRQIITQQLQLLKKAIDGDSKVFGYDLSGVGDLDKVVLMGHSRAGMDVIEWAASQQEDVSVVGIASIAPSFYKMLETKIPDVPMGIIIPELDGDVISLDGNDIYEYIVRDESYTKTAELIYLKNANHGYFNTQLTQPDLNSTEEDIAKMIPAEVQRSFLVGYMSDFVRSVTDNKEPVFASANQLESSAYDCEVLLRVHSGQGSRLYSANGDTRLKGSEAVTVKKENASYIPAENTMGTFKMPGGAAFENYYLQRIVWTGANASVSIPVDGDLSDCRFADIDMALDSSDLKNAVGQAMTLTFTDADGASAKLDIDPGAAALLWQKGELVEQKGWEDEVYYEYSTFTPLVTLRIDLSMLHGMDLGRLKEISLSWPQSEGGSIMLRSIYAVS